MTGLPDPTQIIAASMRRMLPETAAAADRIAEVIVHELQRNGWLLEWEPIHINGVVAAA